MCPKVVKSCRRCRCLILPDSGLVRLGPPRPGAVQRTSQTGPACAQYRESLEDRHAGAKRDIQLGSRHPTNVPRSHRTWTHIHRVRSLPPGVNTTQATGHSRGILVRSDVVEEWNHPGQGDGRAQRSARPKSTVRSLSTKAASSTRVSSCSPAWAPWPRTPTPLQCKKPCPSLLSNGW